VINASAITLAAYALPHLIQSSLANSHMQGRFRHSFWNEAYEAVLSWYIALPTTVALINPRLGKFNVTAKGGLVANDFFDWRISAPYLVLVLLNILGVVIAIPRMLFWNSFEVDTVVINLIWTLFNLTLLGAVLGVAAETRQVREAHRVTKAMPASVQLDDGRRLRCETEDFSMGGVGVKLRDSHRLSIGDMVHVGLMSENQEYTFPVEVVVVRGQRVGLKLQPLTIEEEKHYVGCTFASAAAWNEWSSQTEADRPLSSFAEVFSFGATGYVRLFESIYELITSRWRRPRQSPATMA
jgi:cellulose synthase (UDP-forming)